jgi:hypothetical protein
LEQTRLGANFYRPESRPIEGKPYVQCRTLLAEKLEGRKNRPFLA